jgi:hypothetical protein
MRLVDWKIAAEAEECEFMDALKGPEASPSTLENPYSVSPKTPTLFIPKIRDVTTLSKDRVGLSHTRSSP